MEIASVNKVDNIKFVKGRVEDVPLPCEKVDIIVSEWLGYFLFFEGMLDSVIYARNHYLKPNGLLLPNRCTISITGYGDEERFNNYIGFFNNVYGYNMSCILKDILREGHVETCKEEFVITKPNIINELDINTCDLNYSNFTYDFNLEVTKDSKMTAICGYFDTFFDLPEQYVFFSTSPAAKSTHWKQIVFYLDEPVDVKCGDVISGTFICKRHKNDARSLKVEIKVFNKQFRYEIN
jgi:protein arginine N-methyltransferase 3